MFNLCATYPEISDSNVKSALWNFYFAKFCENMHETEKILGHGGGRPPESATVMCSLRHFHDMPGRFIV